VINDNVQHTTNEATKAALPCHQVFNNKDKDVQDQLDIQRADNTVQHRSNIVVDAQALEDDDNVHGPTSDAMKEGNEDEPDKREGQHADDPVDESSNAARNAPITDDQRDGTSNIVSTARCFCGLPAFTIMYLNSFFNFIPFIITHANYCSCIY
jgi:hypothetical protein